MEYAAEKINSLEGSIYILTDLRTMFNYTNVLLCTRCPSCSFPEILKRAPSLKKNHSSVMKKNYLLLLKNKITMTEKRLEKKYISNVSVGLLYAFDSTESMVDFTFSSSQLAMKPESYLYRSPFINHSDSVKWP